MRSKTERIMCGTCEYWTGSRNPVFDSKGNPKIDIIDQTGNCECAQSSKHDQVRKYELKCNRYCKWSEIL